MVLKQLTQRLEDPQAPLLGPNIWILTKMGLLLPKSFPKKVAYLVFHEFFTLYVLAQYIELYVYKSDLDVILNNLKTSIMTSIIILKRCTFMLWRKEWMALINYVTEADKFERDTRNSCRGRIVDTYTNYCRKVVYCYWTLVLITICGVGSMPIATFLTSQKKYSESLNGTAELPYFLSIWMPFDKNEYPGTTITFHVYACILGGHLILAFDSLVLVIMVFFGGKFDLLRERCKHMLGSDGMGVSDEDVVEATRELHTIHVLLTKNFRLFNSLLSPVLFLYVVGCSLLLCTNLYQLTSAPTTSEKAPILQYTAFCFVQLFLLCWHGNDVFFKSSEVMYGPYESQWWRAGLCQRRCVLLLAGQLRQQHLVTAGPFTNLTLSTFITIVKGSYSYLTILRK